MTKGHLLRLNAPKSWPIKRKGITWIARPRAGPHTLKSAMPLSVVLRNFVKCAKTMKEVKTILYNKDVLVNNRVCKDPNYPVGLFDTISVPKIDEYYRIVLNPNDQLILKKIDKKESTLLLFKIKNKSVLKNKKVQLNFTNGSNLLVAKDIYKSNDSVLVDATKNQIKDHFKFEKGSLVYITSGRRASSVGTFDSLHTFKGFTKDNIIIKTKDGKLETRKSYAFVIGKTKPVISL